MVEHAGTYRVMSFRAVCEECGCDFTCPLISDIGSYGEFILQGERGNGFAYLNSVAEPAWDIIRGLVPPLPKRKDAAAKLAIARFQRVVAACADPIDGEPLTYGPICPRCQSRSIRYGDSEPQGIVELPYASFSSFMRLSPDAQQRRVAELLAREPLPAGAPANRSRTAVLAVVKIAALWAITWVILTFVAAVVIMGIQTGGVVPSGYVIATSLLLPAAGTGALCGLLSALAYWLLLRLGHRAVAVPRGWWRAIMSVVGGTITAGVVWFLSRDAVLVPAIIIGMTCGAAYLPPTIRPS